ncbi:MAG: hypothetical protein FWH26_08255 [Oscillospiraceae bacterium]|nr:hypothetical protein [Oscillospiraceae bacterium]
MRKVLSFEELAELEKIALDTAVLPFHKRLDAFMTFRKWTSLRFTQHTGLDASLYSKMKGGQRKRPDMRTLTAIFMGLRLPLHIAEDLLRSAGMAFTNSLEDRAYRYLFMMMNGATIDECNDFLSTQGVPLLGSFSKDELVSA